MINITLRYFFQLWRVLKRPASLRRVFLEAMLFAIEPVAKPRKIGAKPMGQDVHVGYKTSCAAAQAASAIVNCQLSIVNFSGFAIGSPGFATRRGQSHDEVL
jgi:hypothetical protein